MTEIITNLEELNSLGRAKEVDLETQLKEAREIISLLKKELRKNTNIVALSAPALGFDKRIFCVNYQDNEIKTYINPIIMNSSGLHLSREVCSSLPGKEYVRPRNKTIDLIYQTPTGEIQTKTFKGVAACTIQHEVDHLEGITLDDIGLEIESDFDEASEEEKQQIIDMYLDSLDVKRNKLEQEINEDEELKLVSERLRFTEALAKGEISLEKID